MTLTYFFIALNRHAAYALSVFVLLILVAEWLVPNSVTPFLDPIPFAIFALVLLSMDAFFFESQKKRRWSAIGVSFIGIILLALMFSFSQTFHGRTDQLAGVLLFVVPVFAVATSCFPRES